jgi:hypothetical protein
MPVADVIDMVTRGAVSLSRPAIPGSPFTIEADPAWSLGAAAASHLTIMRHRLRMIATLPDAHSADAHGDLGMIADSLIELIDDSMITDRPNPHDVGCSIAHGLLAIVVRIEETLERWTSVDARDVMTLCTHAELKIATLHHAHLVAHEVR